jgi:hypothetical protein
VVRVTSVVTDVVVREASPPLNEAKVSKPSLAAEVPDEVLCEAQATDVVARELEALPPLHGAGASKLSSAVVVTDEVVGEASDGATVKRRCAIT